MKGAPLTDLNFAITTAFGYYIYNIKNLSLGDVLIVPSGAVIPKTLSSGEIEQAKILAKKKVFGTPTDKQNLNLYNIGLQIEKIFRITTKYYLFINL